MLSDEIIRKLQEMHLGVMAGAFSVQLQDRTANSRPVPLRNVLPCWWTWNGVLERANG